MTIIKPLLAKDVDEDRLQFPCIVMPKIDGSFAMNWEGQLLARSLKQHENKYTTQKYSVADFHGLRGELIVGDDPTAEGLCRNTSSAIRRIEGTPVTSLWCFDYVTSETADLAYVERIKLLDAKVAELNNKGYDFLHYIGSVTVNSLQEYIVVRNRFMNLGYEGIVVRNPSSKHKEGRSSSTKADLWRWKPYGTAEIRCTKLVEQMQNTNEATTNELGRTERSSHKQNLVGKQTLGAIVGILVHDLTDFNGNVVSVAGTELTIATGSLTDKQCKHLWDNPSEIVKQLVEFEYMNFGLKDKPRFSQFKRIRSERDM